ncbi:hypothetical protein F0L68_38700 [Solihabitans fulvus]|uniref:CN hydrolase domain-containing protein n=1 Tax=Solihabitans fulvus TaxID=1892852 RepID=A0A5B2WJ74_9PSEU|nr:nitrilase-related carbon-nitrogen hydrolase [Solihabitans fulvus]KAA2250742.1 hypothetical protein F0L68_38700 [Solihabitans fulvus]
MASGREGVGVPARPGGVVVLAAAAALASAVLFYFGTGLHPVGWLTWLAALPVLLAAPRLSARWAAGTAFLGYLLGGLTMARYYVAVLGLPVPLWLGFFVVTPAIFCLAVLLFRALVLRGRPVLAVVAVAAAWAGAEYLMSVATPSGANWSLATTQADVPLLVQVGSATGVWGISFLVVAVPAAVAAVLAPSAGAAARWRVAGVVAVVLGLALGYGAVRLSGSSAVSLRVTLVAAHKSERDPLDIGTAEGRRLLDADLAWLESMPDDGTRLVVFPEKDLAADDGTLPGMEASFSRLAKARGVVVVVGLRMRTDGVDYNTSLAFPADGGSPVRYRKQHLMAGGEGGIVPGAGSAFAPGLSGRVGLAICADMGHPSLGREYGRLGAGLLAVPAWDFDVDAWSQSRVQSMRGVENGFAVVRAARQGYLTVTDPNGRVLGQTLADTSSPVNTLTVTVPVGDGAGTLYSRWGEWFAWLCLAVTALAVVLASRRAARKPESTPASHGMYRRSTSTV